MLKDILLSVTWSHTIQSSILEALDMKVKIASCYNNYTLVKKLRGEWVDKSNN